MEEIVKYYKVPAWNSYDEFGLLLGLERLPGETNQDFRKRIYDAGQYFGSSTKQGLVNALAAELQLDRYIAEDKTFFSLSYQPVLIDRDTKEILSFNVYVNGVEWTDYDTDPTATTYYKLWKFPDGTPTRVLELSPVFSNGSQVRVRYYRVEDAAPRLWTDESEYPDETFLAYREETPISGEIELYELHDEDFKNTHLLDSEGTPNALYESIVEQIHQIYPILWGQFIWDKTYFDVGDERVTGIEYMPSRFDASMEYLSGEFGSGIGYGTDCAVYDSINVSGEDQLVLIHPGYFYLCADEYYFFAQKSRDCSVTGMYEYYSPIILTVPDASGDLYYDDHFGETWMDEKFDEKFLHVSDLSGCLSGDYDGMWDVPWFSIDQSGVITISGDAEYLCEFDISGYYESDIDFNPAHYVNFTNKFLVIKDSDLWPSRLQLTYVDWYIKRSSKDCDFIGGVYPDNSATIRADVFDHVGTPITDPKFTVELEIRYDSILVETDTSLLDEEGSATFTFPDLMERIVVSPRDFLINGTVLLDDLPTDVTAYLHIPFGL